MTRRIDWEAVERDYRTGKYTLRQLEAQHGVSYAQISRKAKAEAWSKDLREIIRQETDAALLRETVTKAQKDVTETVLVAAELNKQVILGHRSDIVSMRNVAADLLNEIAQATRRPEEIEALFDMLNTEVDEKKLESLQQSFRDFMRVHSRVGSVQKLADTLTKLQTMERRAFGIGEEDGEKQPGEVMPVFNITMKKE